MKHEGHIFISTMTLINDQDDDNDNDNNIITTATLILKIMNKQMSYYITNKQTYTSNNNNNNHKFRCLRLLNPPPRKPHPQKSPLDELSPAEIFSSVPDMCSFRKELLACKRWHHGHLLQGSTRS